MHGPTSRLISPPSSSTTLPNAYKSRADAGYPVFPTSSPSNTASIPLLSTFSTERSTTSHSLSALSLLSLCPLSALSTHRLSGCALVHAIAVCNMASTTSVFFWIVLFCTVAAATITGPRTQEACIVTATDEEVCKPMDAIGSVVHKGRMRRKKKAHKMKNHKRGESYGAPCPQYDKMCWAGLALKYTNEVRRRVGSKPLVLGCPSQFQNANQYAATLSRMGKLKHQKFAEAMKMVKCGRWMGGENLAFNYAIGDVARFCVDQWIDSPGHLENLKRFWFKEMALGMHFDNDGRIWCVQTFMLVHPKGYGVNKGRGCTNIGKN